jgi:hypothetical protein
MRTLTTGLMQAGHQEKCPVDNYSPIGVVQARTVYLAIVRLELYRQ